jgi:hypothetical protein
MCFNVHPCATFCKLQSKPILNGPVASCLYVLFLELYALITHCPGMQGGAVFIATQSFSWSLFVITAIGIVHTARAVSAGLMRLSPLLAAILILAAALTPLTLSASALAFVDASCGASQRLASGISRTLESDAPISAAVCSVHQLITCLAPPFALRSSAIPLDAPLAAKTRRQRRVEERKHAKCARKEISSKCLASHRQQSNTTWHSKPTTFALLAAQDEANKRRMIQFLNRCGCVELSQCISFQTGAREACAWCCICKAGKPYNIRHTLYGIIYGVYV